MAYCRANIWHVALGQSDLFKTRAHPLPNHRETLMVPVVNLLDSVCVVSMHLLYNIVNPATKNRTKTTKLPIFFTSTQQVVSMLVSICQKMHGFQGNKLVITWQFVPQAVYSSTRLWSRAFT